MKIGKRIGAMGYEEVRGAYARLEWTVRGFVSLDTYTRSGSDMRNALLRAAGTEIRDFPSHPDEYLCSVGDLYAALPPDTRQALAKQGIPEDPDADALWGRGWFGDVLPGYMGTFAWSPNAVEPDVGPVPQFVNPIPGVETSRLGDYRSRGLVDELQEVEEAAADGDFLSHLKIRAAFAGIASLCGANRELVVDAARTFPTPTLAGYYRVYRERDKASSRAFRKPGMVQKCIDRGREIFSEAGGLSIPDLVDKPNLEVVVNDVAVEIHFPAILGIDSEVVDVIGFEAAQAAMAEAAKELASYRITVTPIQMS